MPQLVHEDSNLRPDLSTILDQYRPMTRLLSAADLKWLGNRGYYRLARFRKERAAIYFQYLGDLRRDLRALNVWEVSGAATSFIEQDCASWLMYRTLFRLALEGVLYYIGIERRQNRRIESCFDELRVLLSAAA